MLAGYSEVAELAAARPAGSLLDNLDVPSPDHSLAGLPLMIGLSLLGGLLLNLMPCVLPVIGLESLVVRRTGRTKPGSGVLLNAWYSIGMLLVFWVLATLSVTLNLGWGEHFGSTAFKVTMSAIVFAMALSFLGLWEIPIPGFVGSGSAVHMAAREGAMRLRQGCAHHGAGHSLQRAVPGLGIRLHPEAPPYVTYIIFTSIGLGMASPYLLFGAFPRLVHSCPSQAPDGTFKQLMAFMLLGTVVFMFASMDRDYLVPTFTLLIGIWAGCWWIGRVPLTYSFGRRMLGWLEGAAVAPDWVFRLYVARALRGID